MTTSRQSGTTGTPHKIHALAGIVVLYRPKPEAVRNIRSYLGRLKVLYVVNNTPSGADVGMVSSELQSLSNVEFIHEGGNIGIAKALNMAVLKALDGGYEWLLTMDQDSYFRPEQAARFFGGFARMESHAAAVYAPSHYAVDGHGECIFRDVDIVWTSGNLLNVRIAVELGLFNEEYFIDSVDHEYCLRLRSRGYCIQQATNAFLDHELGQERVVCFLKKKKKQFHSPKRLYFMIRNGLCLADSYREFFPEFIDACSGQIRTELVRALKYSNERMRYVYYAFKAWRDFRNGVTGNPVEL
jgi:rhamnosyltransferase